MAIGRVSHLNAGVILLAIGIVSHLNAGVILVAIGRVSHLNAGVILLAIGIVSHLNAGVIQLAIGRVSLSPHLLGSRSLPEPLPEETARRLRNVGRLSRHFGEESSRHCGAGRH